MAAYVLLASLLANKRYVGDLKLGDPQVQRCRVFADEAEAIAVLHTASTDGISKLKLRVPIRRLEGIDGRRLAPAEDGSVFVGDGVAYVWLEPEGLDDHLVKNTTAGKLWQAGRQPAPTRPSVSPIVLRYQFSSEMVEAGSDGYRVKPAAIDEMPVVVRVFNTADKPHELTLRPSIAEAGISPPEARTVRMDPESSIDVTWTVDLTGAFDNANSTRLTVVAASQAGPGITPLAIDFLGKATARTH
jgi:hypothetical protein